MAEGRVELRDEGVDARGQRGTHGLRLRRGGLLGGLTVTLSHVAVLPVHGRGMAGPGRCVRARPGPSCLGSADCLLSTVGATYSTWQAARRMKGPE